MSSLIYSKWGFYDFRQLLITCHLIGCQSTQQFLVVQSLSDLELSVKPGRHSGEVQWLPLTFVTFITPSPYFYLSLEERANTYLLLGMCLDSCARYLLFSKQLSQAQRMYEKALQICQEIQGERHPQVIDETVRKPGLPYGTGTLQRVTRSQVQRCLAKLVSSHAKGRRREIWPGCVSQW